MKLTSGHRGYQFGMRQAATRVQLVFTLPEQISFPKIDSWINDALETDIQTFKPIFLTDCVSFEKTAGMYITRWLCITTVLLQDICIPVFERPTIVSIKKSDKQSEEISADIWFPIVENFPAEIFHTWIGISGELLKTIPKFLNDQQTLESYYTAFHQNQVLPWADRIQGGKSTIPILQSAFNQRIPFSHLGAGKYLLGWGSQSKIFDRSSNSLDSAIGSWASQNKDVAIRLMKGAGIPVPNGIKVDSENEIRFSSVSHLGIPLVVKPVDRDRGEGVTLGIESERELKQAVKKALSLSRAALIEEQIIGTCHRVLVINDKIVYVVKRNPKGVVGDGISSIETLIFHANNRIRRKIPQKRLPALQLDQEALHCLKEASLNPESIPTFGQRVFLRAAQSTQWGGDPEEITTELHPDNAELCVRAARLLRLNCAGVDFISQDIAIPWHQNGAVINEVNFSPVMGRTHQYQRNATHLYMKSLFPERGVIPIKVFLGQPTKNLAIEEWRRQQSKGLGCYLCFDQGLLNPDGIDMHLANTKSIFDTISMLRGNTLVDAIVCHTADKDLFFSSGFPFEDGVIYTS